MSKRRYGFHEDPDNKRRREAFERDCQCVISRLDSLHAKRRASDEFHKALAAINVALFAMAYSFLRSRRNLARRRDLAEEARQIWHKKMLAVGFKSYLTKGKPFGKPFGPYARVSLHHICVSLLRDRRVCTLPSLDGFSDPRRDPREAAERRELELDCRDLMKTLPPHWQELLRSLYWEGRSNFEASDQLDVNPQTVANWHLRSRKQLGNEFRRRGYWPP
jgi:RNA polymerase sigma factor (sigma-70 family)